MLQVRQFQSSRALNHVSRLRLNTKIDYHTKESQKFIYKSHYYHQSFINRTQFQRCFSSKSWSTKGGNGGDKGFWERQREEERNWEEIHRLKNSRINRQWAIFSMILLIPPTYWLYKKHNSPNPHDEQADSLTEKVGWLYRWISKTEISKSAPSFTIKCKYLLIGGGAASFAAMQEILRLEPDADILIVSEEKVPPYSRPPLSKELWFEDIGNLDQSKSLIGVEFTDWQGVRKPLLFLPEDFYKINSLDDNKAADGGDNGKKIRLLVETRVENLDINNRTAILADGRLVTYEKALIATGSTPKMLPIEYYNEGPEKNSPGESCIKKVLPESLVSNYRSIDDFARLRSIIKSGLRIGIVGGGFLGSELAVSLAQFSRDTNKVLKVTQVFPEAGNMALVFPRYLSEWTTARICDAGVNVISSAVIKKIEVGPQSVSLTIENKTRGEQKIEFDHVILAIGSSPSTELPEKAGLMVDDKRGGVIADSNMHVSNGIYAAGDVVSFYDPSLGIQRRVEHYEHALRTGTIAGANMIKEKSKTYNTQSMFWSDLGPEIGYEAVGLVDSSLSTVGVWSQATLGDSPRSMELDPSDVRTEKIGLSAYRQAEGDPSEEPSHSIIPSAIGESSYGKGVVFYINEKRIVGVLMFNLFNRISLARDVIKKQRSIDDLDDIVTLFNVNDSPDGPQYPIHIEKKPIVS